MKLKIFEEDFMSENFLTQTVEYWGLELMVFFSLGELIEEEIRSYIKDNLGLERKIFFADAFILIEQGMFFISSESIPKRLSSFYNLEEKIILSLIKNESTKIKIAYIKLGKKLKKEKKSSYGNIWALKIILIFSFFVLVYLIFQELLLFLAFQLLLNVLELC